MARREIQGNGIGQDPDIKDSGERVLEDCLGSGPVLSRTASHRVPATGLGSACRFQAPGRRQSVGRSSAQTGDRLLSHHRHSSREA
ncbi:hypothetical protein Sala_2629 [Sphingopyxis alaskensis RB2256]|uniref:Uncharacterized protein n=1 Tax=Sphingopyxis alaskensis (strain DSM 13593 / LMG 18877 / RB2256) TaxID=317655 RepID=Q1GPT7_SPHAL|nr:hypothetical protein Sala_2629 [Sphingopyxis alaskensis RB2256]